MSEAQKKRGRPPKRAQEIPISEKKKDDKENIVLFLALSDSDDNN